MSVNVQELYQQTVLPLPEPARLQLMALIANDLARPHPTNGAPPTHKRKGDITKFFGMWKGGAADDSDNEKIDADLACAYTNTNEGEG